LEKRRPAEEEDRWEKKRRIGRKGGNEQRAAERRNGSRCARDTEGESREKVQRKEKSERQRKINDSKYNETYKNILTEELPKYLKGRRKRKNRSLIVKYRCRNEEVNTGRRKKIEDAEYVGMRKKPYGMY